MTEKEQLEIWNRVNKCETLKELKEILMSLTDSDGQIQGRTRKFSAESMCKGAEMYYEGLVPANVVTREFGLRQQLMYITSFKL